MHDPMYVVRWLKDGVVVLEERFGDLGDAKRHATESVQLFRALRLASSAVVCGNDGTEHMRVF